MAVVLCYLQESFRSRPGGSVAIARGASTDSSVVPLQSTAGLEALQRNGGGDYKHMVSCPLHGESWLEMKGELIFCALLEQLTREAPTGFTLS